jgi:chromosome segregation ATPase
LGLKYEVFDGTWAKFVDDRIKTLQDEWARIRPIARDDLAWIKGIERSVTDLGEAVNTINQRLTNHADWAKQADGSLEKLQVRTERVDSSLGKLDSWSTGIDHRLKTLHRPYLIAMLTFAVISACLGAALYFFAGELTDTKKQLLMLQASEQAKAANHTLEEKANAEKLRDQLNALDAKVASLTTELNAFKGSIGKGDREELDTVDAKSGGAINPVVIKCGEGSYLVEIKFRDHKDDGSGLGLGAIWGPSAVCAKLNGAN